MRTMLFEENVPARMRDGITLYADVFRPAEPGQYPVLIARTPYGKELDRVRLAQFLDPLRATRAGYAVLVQDCRGCNSSEGEPAEDFGASIDFEGPDGYDTVEWAASLPYSSGAVGMFGLSYLGIVQWIAAMQKPPHLRAIVPMNASTCTLEATQFRGGAFDMSVLPVKISMAAAAVTRQMQKTGATPQQVNEMFRRIMDAGNALYRTGYRELPLVDLPSLSELGLAEILAPALAHRQGEPPAFQVDFSAVEVPALIIGGWYDLLLQYSIKSYDALRSQNRRPHLLVGPWRHGDTGRGRDTTMGEMDFGTAASGSSIDLTASLTDIHLRWYDRWLRGVNNGVDREPPVHVFVMGENRWRKLPDWPSPEMQQKPWFLMDGGRLSKDLPDASAARYTYDPADPAPTLGGTSLMPGLYSSGVKDQRRLSARPDVLTFFSNPLDMPLTIMGRVTAQLWAGSSAPDTDFVVRLIDVHPDGYMHNLCDGIIRARYRDSLSEPTWLEPGQVYEFSIDLWSTAHTFLPDHQIAVQVTSSNFPRYDRNLNTTDAPGAGVISQLAEQTVWLGVGYPSRVLLPVLVVE